MKAYVIKFTKEQFCTLICALEYTRDKYDLYRAEEFTKEVEDLRKEIYKQQPQFHGKEITIYEGDLEEENRMLKKALELMKERANTLIKDFSPFTPQYTEHFLLNEEDYIQQAKESEKDD